MRAASLAAQLGTLRHSKAVLLVCDHKAKVHKMDTLRNQCVRAKAQVDFSSFQRIVYSTLLRWRQ